MASPGRSMLYSLLLFIIILSLLEMYRGKLASSEVLTIAGGFISSLLFVVMLTFIGNYQESSGSRTGWGAVILAEVIALIAASTVHRVCITTCKICTFVAFLGFAIDVVVESTFLPKDYHSKLKCLLFSAGFLYEINKLSTQMLVKGETKAKWH